MSERWILHSDADCFYASVETVLDPTLRGKPIAVCGSTSERHGIVLAKSYIAKRAGIRTGMTNAEAKKRCPSLIVVPPHFERYSRFSAYLRGIYSRYTDAVEPFGLDECWLDISSLPRDPVEVAEQIRREVRDELGLTVSIGVSFNKVFAKLGSDMKKPDAITVIRRSEFKEKIWNLPACDMLWVGRSTYKTLKRYGILTIGDIAKTSVDTLVSLLGKNGELLWKCANGYENSEVSDFLSTPEIKSVGRGITLVSDITENDEIYRVILSLSHEVSRELRKHRLSACGVQISVKSNELKSVQFQKKTNFLTQNAREIADLAFSLFDERYDRELPVRAISVRAFDLLESDCAVQLDMFFDIEKHIKREKIEKAMLSINKKYGKNTVKEATLFCDTKMPKGKTDCILLPKSEVMG